MNRYKKIIRDLAQQEGVSQKEIRRKLQDVIDIARQSPNPQVQNEWKKIHPGYGTPTPEEMINYYIRAVEIKNP